MNEPSRNELRSGVALQPVDDPRTFGAMTREIEDLGFDNLWLTDSSLHARNCYSYLALAAERSTRLVLGTAVTNPLTRHPAITASAMATVDEISGGRAVLGIGAGDRPLLALGLKPSPVADLEAAITAVRALWSGARSTSRRGRSPCTRRTYASRPAPTYPCTCRPAGRARWSWPGAPPMA